MTSFGNTLNSGREKCIFNNLINLNNLYSICNVSRFTLWSFSKNKFHSEWLRIIFNVVDSMLKKKMIFENAVVPKRTILGFWLVVPGTIWNCWELVNNKICLFCFQVFFYYKWLEPMNSKNKAFCSHFYIQELSAK